MSRPVPTLCLVALLVLAGCSLPGTRSPTPTPAPTPDITVTLANEANQSYTLAYWTVAGPVDSVRVRTADGGVQTVDNLTARAGARLFDTANATEVVWPDTAQQRGSFQLTPGSSVSGPVEDPAPQTTVLFLARTDDRVVAWGTADCGDDASLTSVDFVMDDPGPGLSIGCGGFGGDSRDVRAGG